MKHCIIVKFNETVDKAKLEELEPKIQALFDNTKSIKGIHEVSVKRNIIDRSNRYDLLIEISMDPAVLSDYDSCIWHKMWKEQYGCFIESKAIIDLE